MTTLESVAITAFVIMSLIALASLGLLLRAKYSQDQERIILGQHLEILIQACSPQFPIAVDTARAILAHVRGRYTLDAEAVRLHFRERYNRVWSSGAWASNAPNMTALEKSLVQGLRRNVFQENPYLQDEYRDYLERLENERQS